MNKNDHLYHNNGDLTFTDVTNLLAGRQLHRSTAMAWFHASSITTMMDGSTSMSPTTSDKNLVRTCSGGTMGQGVQTVGFSLMCRRRPMRMWQFRRWALRSAITTATVSLISS